MRAFFILSVALAATAFAAERYALVIGVDGYQELGRLKSCVADAQALAKVLVDRAGFDSGKVVLVTDASTEPQNRPTLATLRRRIAQVVQLAEKGDTLLIFFSGHGNNRDGQGYLIPVDGDLNNAIALSWMGEQLEKSQAATKVLVLDACHAGSAAKGVAGIAPGLASAVMLLSSGKDEISHVDEVTGHSIFSLHLVDGLRGEADSDHDGAITVGEAYEYVKGRLKEWSLKTGKSQTPVLHGEERGKLELVRLAPGAAPPKEYYLKIREAEKLLRELEEEMKRKAP